MLLSPGISTRKLINRVELYYPLDKKRCLRYLAESCENVRGWRMLSGRRLRDKAIQIVSNSGVWQIEY